MLTDKVKVHSSAERPARSQHPGSNKMAWKLQKEYPLYLSGFLVSYSKLGLHEQRK